MTKSNPKKTDRENMACYAALTLVFGAPILGILQALGAFGVVLIAVAVFFFVRAFIV